MVMTVVALDSRKKKKKAAVIEHTTVRSQAYVRPVPSPACFRTGATICGVRNKYYMNDMLNVLGLGSIPTVVTECQSYFVSTF